MLLRRSWAHRENYGRRSASSLAQVLARQMLMTGQIGTGIERQFTQPRNGGCASSTSGNAQVADHNA
jgi:hypothetical protein